MVETAINSINCSGSTEKGHFESLVDALQVLQECIRWKTCCSWSQTGPFTPRFSQRARKSKFQTPKKIKVSVLAVVVTIIIILEEGEVYLATLPSKCSPDNCSPVLW